jgi:hypothetical protein
MREKTGRSYTGPSPMVATTCPVRSSSDRISDPEKVNCPFIGPEPSPLLWPKRPRSARKLRLTNFSRPSTWTVVPQETVAAPLTRPPSSCPPASRMPSRPPLPGVYDQSNGIRTSAS